MWMEHHRVWFPSLQANSSTQALCCTPGRISPFLDFYARMSLHLKKYLFTSLFQFLSKSGSAEPPLFCTVPWIHTKVRILNHIMSREQKMVPSAYPAWLPFTSKAEECAASYLTSPYSSLLLQLPWCGWVWSQAGLQSMLSAWVHALKTSPGCPTCSTELGSERFHHLWAVWHSEP